MASQNGGNKYFCLPRRKLQTPQNIIILIRNCFIHISAGLINVQYSKFFAINESSFITKLRKLFPTCLVSKIQ